MIFYNIIIFLMVRTSENLFYSLYMSFFLLFQICVSGFGFSQVYDHYWFTELGSIIFAFLAIIFVLPFSIVFLKVKKHAPFLDVLGRALMMFFILCLVTPFIDFRLSAYFAVAANFLLCTWIVCVSVVLLKQKNILALIYLLAWIIYVVLDQFTILYYIGMLEYSWLTTWGMTIGALVEASLISLGLGINIYLLREESRAHMESEQRLKKDMENAKLIQDSLITINLPENLEYCLWYRSAHYTAGDWVCAEYKKDSGRLYVAIGDVTGHGLGSSLMTVAAVGLFKSCIERLEVESTSGPEKLRSMIAEINGFVHGSQKSNQLLMTAAFVCFDLKERKFYYSNAGHLPIYCYSPTKNAIVSIFNRGSIIGLMENPEIKVETFELEIDCQIIMFTDGLLENKIAGVPALTLRKIRKIFLKNRLIVEVERELKKAHGDTINPDIDDDISLLLLDFASIDLSAQGMYPEKTKKIS